jgi:hypothetical protein
MHPDKAGILTGFLPITFRDIAGDIMKEIFLSQGLVAWVDDGMYRELNQYNWYANKSRNTYYARRHVVGDSDKKITMYHAVMGFPPKGFISDHRDGNGLNNQRKNLRFVTSRQNRQNLNNIILPITSEFPGVGWHKKDKKWQARITINGKQKFLGNFKTEISAFEAYKQAVENLGQTVIDTAIQQRSIL